MTITNYIPNKSLSGLVKNFTVFKSEEELTRTILPETAPLMCFSVQGNAVYTINGAKQKLEGAFFSGLRKNYKQVTFSKKTEAILVRFHESAAGLFLEPPLHTFFGNGASLDNFYSARHIEHLQDQLACSSNDTQKIIYLETFLQRILKEKKPDKLVLDAASKIKISNGTVRINELASQAGLSLDVFEKRFRRIVGGSPKQYSSIVRMNYAINNWVNEKSLTSLAFDSGYFDQNHFIKDFKAFTGETPFNYFKIRASSLTADKNELKIPVC